MKVCIECSKPKPEADFYPNRKSCKPCVAAKVRANYLKNRDKFVAYDLARSQLPHRVKARNEYAQTCKGRERSASAKRAYAERNPRKRAAHVAVGNALRDGQIWKSPCCMAPDCFCTDSLHGHHVNYDEQLNVVWLCGPCHVDLHRQHDERYGTDDCVSHE